MFILLYIEHDYIFDRLVKQIINLQMNCVIIIIILAKVAIYLDNHSNVLIATSSPWHSGLFLW